MPFDTHEEDGGKFLAIHVSGRLGRRDYQEFVPKFEQSLHDRGRLRVMIEMHDFHGWHLSGLWEEMKFDVKHYRDIERLAVIGENGWQHALGVMCRPFTMAKVRYFPIAEEEKAKDWLRESMATAPAG